MDMQLDKKIFKQIDGMRNKFALLPANIIVFCKETSDGKQAMDEWIKRIEEAVDEQEHSLKICNVTDLEKRLRKQKTSKEGVAETIHITNPQRIKQIDAWRKRKNGYVVDDDDKKQNMSRNARSVSINMIKTTVTESDAKKQN